MRTERSILEGIRERKELTDEIREGLDAELKKFVRGFNVETEEGAPA
jgi:hypothetical protein